MLHHHHLPQRRRPARARRNAPTTALAVALAVAAGLSLTACGSRTASTTASNAAAGGTAQGENAPAARHAHDAHQAADAGHAPAVPVPSSSAPRPSVPVPSVSASAAAGDARACRTGALSAAWAPASKAVPGTADQRTANVVLTNRGARACSMNGFPELVLRHNGIRWRLVRQTTTPGMVRLAPGASAHFAITYLRQPVGAPGAFTPGTAKITLPGRDDSIDLPWRWGSILMQQSATNPGTYVGPVMGAS